MDLGLEDRIVGVTKFCVHPKGLKKQKTIIGGTKNFHLDKIEALQPDLIIGNKEENYQEGIELLKKKYPVWMSDIYTLEDALEMMRGIGEITGTSDRADELIREVNRSFNFQPLKKGSAVYLIWKDPLMAVGKNTFVDDIIRRCGFLNLINQTRYPEVDLDFLKSLSIDYLLLSSEPFPFKEKHRKEFLECFPGTKVIIVDGEMFSWYGSRLIKAGNYLKTVQ